MEIILISNKTGRTRVTEMTGRQLLETNEDDLVDKMAECDCEPTGDSMFTECDCFDEWMDYMLIVGNENNYNNIDYSTAERV